jgi:hypothetical protein
VTIVHVIQKIDDLSIKSFTIDVDQIRSISVTSYLASSEPKSADVDSTGESSGEPEAIVEDAQQNCEMTVEYQGISEVDLIDFSLPTMFRLFKGRSLVASVSNAVDAEKAMLIHAFGIGEDQLQKTL